MVLISSCTRQRAERCLGGVLIALVCTLQLVLLRHQHSPVSAVQQTCPIKTTSLDDILVLVSVSNRSHTDALWRAWGYRLGDTHSLQFYSLNPTLVSEPLVKPTKYKGVTEIQWRGYEAGERRTMTYKTKKTFEILPSRHSDRNWFIKTDDDTLVVVPVLQELLSKYDPTQPWYMGYTWPKGVWQDIEFNSGSFYILSKAALQQLLPLFSSQKFDIEHSPEHEDVMISRLCQQAGIRPHNLAPLVFWSGPELRAQQHPNNKYMPFVSVHNIKDPDTLIKLGATLDAFVERQQTCYIN